MLKDMRQETGVGMQAGKDLERGFVGSLYLNQNEVSYLPYKEAFTQVLRLRQPNKKPLVRQIIQEIYRQYGIFEQAGLDYYASADTAFDYYHGIDCFFMLNLNGSKYIVTIDVTQNPNKSQAKADIVIHIDYDSDGAVTLSDTSVKNIARDIAEEFKKKVSARQSTKSVHH